MQLLKTSANLPYAVALPDDFDANKVYPVLFFLHGLGERGTDLDYMVNKFGPIKSIIAGKVKFPGIVIEPLLPKSIGQWSFDVLQPVMQAVMKKYKVNAAQMYLTGLSLGAGGCSFVLNKQQDLFAAIAALSASRGIDGTIACKITSALWYWHNLDDTTCSPTYSINTLVNVWACRGWEGNKNTLLASKPKGLYTTHDGINWVPGAVPGGLTLNDTGGHGGWQAVYDDQRLYDWLLTNVKGSVKKQLQVTAVNIDPEQFAAGKYELQVGDFGSISVIVY